VSQSTKGIRYGFWIVLGGIGLAVALAAIGAVSLIKGG
jgi:hypothetical protein